MGGDKEIGGVGSHKGIKQQERNNRERRKMSTKQDVCESILNWSFCKTKNPREYLKGTEGLSCQSCASK